MTRQEQHETVRSSTPNPNHSARDLSISQPVQVNILGNGLHEETGQLIKSELNLQQSKESILQKINWASAKLQNSNSIQESIDLCKLIQSCAEALTAVSSLNMP